MSKLSKSMQEELTALAAQSEHKIDFLDISATTTQDQIDAEREKFYRPIKQQLTVRVDADVLAWLKSQGKGYQSRLNDILRTAMLDTAKHQQLSSICVPIQRPEVMLNLSDFTN